MKWEIKDKFRREYVDKQVRHIRWYSDYIVNKLRKTNDKTN